MNRVSLALMSFVYVAAGSMHFIRPKVYLKIMPPYLPSPLTLVYLSGVAEILLGLLLWVPSLSPYAAWGIIALLIAVFPANFYMFRQGEAVFHIPQWVLVLRLPLQAVLIYWAYTHTLTVPQ